MNFDVTLEDAHFHLSPMQGTDIADLQQAASDPLIWEGHPARDRFLPEVFGPYADFLLDAGGTLVIREQPRGRVVGCSRYYASSDVPEGVCIGFTFLTRAHWGGESNRRVKRLMLTHGFAHHDAVWFHIAPDNLRSQRATAKLGAVYRGDATEKLGTARAPWQRWELQKVAAQRGGVL